MTQMIFVNLPVTDLPRSTAFYNAVGFTQNDMFSDSTASAMMLSEAIHVMLLTHEKWRQFSDRAIPDAHKVAQVLLAISRDDRAGVDRIVEEALEAGGLADPTPKQEHDFMYGRSFADPDGHIWEVMWMDSAQFAASASHEEMAA